MLLALPLLFVACNDSKDVDDIKPTFVLTSAETLEFSADAATGEISYKLENPVEGQAVAATANVEWINNFQYGEKVTFAVEANEATEAREGKITVSYTTLSFEVTVKQAGKTLKPEVAIVAGEAAEFEAEGGNGEIEYELKNAAEGVELKVACEAAWVKDLKVVAADSKVTYTVEANAAAQSRNATIVLTYGESKAEATVKQKPYVEEGKSALDLKSEATAKFKAEGGNGVVKFEVINPAEGVKAEAKTEAAWITGLTVNADNTEVAYTVAANTTFEARKGTIVVTYGEAKIEVAVEQEAAAKPELKVTSNAVKEFAAEGGNGEFAYELKNPVEGTKLAVECKAEWIKATLDEKNSKVTYTVAANETDKAREAIITLAYGELKAEALVKQAAKGEETKAAIIVKAEDAVKEFEAAGGNGEASFTLENAAEGAKVEAKADEAATWISKVAVADNKVTYTVAANETDKAREAKITLTCGEAKAEITVKQKAATPAGPSFTLKSPAEIPATANGGTGMIGFALEGAVEGVEVTASADVSWISFGENYVDYEKSRINYYVSETDSKEPRTGVITAKYGEYGSFTVTINQKGGSEIFNVSANETEFIGFEACDKVVNFTVKFPTDPTTLPVATVQYLTAGQEDWITDFAYGINEDKEPAEGEGEGETEPETFAEDAEDTEGAADVVSGYISFKIAENTSADERKAVITYTYNGQTKSQTITQATDVPLQTGFTFYTKETPIRASYSDEGKTWTLKLIEDCTAENFGETVFTELVLNLNEPTFKYIPSGTYTDPNFVAGYEYTYDSATLEAGSLYRTNNDACKSLIFGDDRYIKLDVNKDTKTVNLEAKFLTSRFISEENRYRKVEVTIKYEGNVDGFDFTEEGAIVSDWTEFKVNTSYPETKGGIAYTEYFVLGTAADGTIFNFDMWAYGSHDTLTLAAGTYTLMDWPNPNWPEYNWCNMDYCKIGTTLLKSGEVIVTDNSDGTQTLTYTVVDVNGSEHKGEYTGPAIKKSW